LATAAAPSALAILGSSTANSSPPSRATVSTCRRGRLQPLADLQQQLVAVVVAEGVVDLLEAVQVDQRQRGRAQLPVGLADRLADTVAQQGAVG